MTTLGLLGALLLKPAALASVAFGVTAMMRRSAAAARHAVWVAAIGATLALPLLAAALPDLRVRSVDDGFRRVSAAVQTSRASRESLTATPSDAPSRAVDRALTPSDAGNDPGPRVAWVAFLVWALVALLLLSRRIAAEWRVHRLAGTARPASDRLRRLGARVARGDNLMCADLRVTGLVAAPAVVGVLHPIVLLPDTAEGWTDVDLEAMLVHELGHAVRRDCLVNLGADVAASLYWCNPLVRLSARRLRLEGERACDERVVRSGTDPRAYAKLLLRVARAGRCALAAARAATAMARARELESRLVALLDGPVPRAPVSRGVATLLVALGVATTVPAAALTIGAAEATVQQVMPPEPDRLGDSLAAPSSERVPLRIAADDFDRRVAEALAGTDSILARRLLIGVRHTPTHAADLVRERAYWALAQTTNGRVIAPLLESLNDGDWRVQAYAAWALAIAGDARAVPRLIPLVRHPVWRLRAMAAYALREGRDPRAFDAMRAALTDPAWQVRAEAVEYIAAVGGRDVRALIRARLADRHIAVRRAAQRAIGTP